MSAHKVVPGPPSVTKRWIADTTMPKDDLTDTENDGSPTGIVHFFATSSSSSLAVIAL